VLGIKSMHVDSLSKKVVSLSEIVQMEVAGKLDWKPIKYYDWKPVYPGDEMVFRQITFAPFSKGIFYEYLKKHTTAEKFAEYSTALAGRGFDKSAGGHKVAIVLTWLVAGAVTLAVIWMFVAIWISRI